MPIDDLKVFTGNAHPALAKQITEYLGIPLGKCEVFQFSNENTFVRILEKHGFEVLSACCKVGGVPKEFLGLKDREKVRIGTYETMCNPITQAEIFNAAKTDFNVLVGLCVGHDSLFFKHAKALSTVLVAKDRVLGHNPVAALYGVKVYFQRLIKP